MLKQFEVNGIIIRLISDFYRNDNYWSFLIDNDLRLDTQSFVIEFSDDDRYCSYHNGVKYGLELEKIYNKFFLPTLINECDEICDILCKSVLDESDMLASLTKDKSVKIPLKHRVMARYLSEKTTDLLRDLQLIKNKPGLIRYQALYRGNVVRWRIPCFCRSF